MEAYNILVFRFVDKKSRCRFEVYARTLETAQKIIDIENTNNDVFKWSKKKIGFIKKAVSNIPPYDLELQQIETASKRLKNRTDYAKKERN